MDESKTFSEMTEEEVVDKVEQFRTDCEMGNADLFARMIKSARFSQTNDQWDPEVAHYRKHKKKFCLTIPLIKPQIKQVVGAQIQNPKDIVVEPERSGSATGARILSRLVKHAMDQEQAVFELTQWFDAGLSTGMGFIAAFIDRHEDPRHGNLTLEKLNEFECGLDPACVVFDINSYLQGAKYFIYEPWVDKDLIHTQYPDKVRDLQGAGEGTSFRDRMTLWWSSIWDGLFDGARKFSGPGGMADVNVAKYKYKVNHTWWRCPKRCVVLYRADEPETESITVIDDGDIKLARRLAEKQPNRFEVEEVVVNVPVHTKRVGNVVLENNEDELNGVTDFPIGVYSPYFANGYRSGMAEDMIGTQEEINWAHSQNLQVIKHLSTYHWKMKSDVTGGMADWLSANADEDNLVIDLSKFGGDVQKGESRPNLSGLGQFAEVAKENLKLISNVRTEDPSFDRKSMSGKAIALKQINSQTGQAFIFTNYDYAFLVFGKIVVNVIRVNGVYSQDEIRAICEKDDLINAEMMETAREQVRQAFQEAGHEIPEPPQMPAMGTGGMPDPSRIAALQEQMVLVAKFSAAVDKLARPIAEQMLMEEIGNLNKGRYTTKVSLSPYAPTMRLAERSEIEDLNQSLINSGYAPLARKRLIEATDVKNKEAILQENEAMANVPQLAPQLPMGGAKTRPQVQRGAA